MNDGAPFCSNCRAPQIRFVPPEPVETLPGPGLADGEIAPAATRLVWPQAFYAALMGGVFSALVMNFLGGLLGLGFIGGGVVAVYAYRRRVPGAVLSLGSGAKLGAVSGLLGFVVFGVLLTLEVLLKHAGGKFYEMIFESLNQTARNSDPQIQQQMQDMIQQLNTPEGFAVLMIFMCIVVCLIFVFFSVLGGAIGSSMTRRKSGC